MHIFLLTLLNDVFTTKSNKRKLPQESLFSDDDSSSTIGANEFLNTEQFSSTDSKRQRLDCAHATASSSYQLPVYPGQQTIPQQNYTAYNAVRQPSTSYPAQNTTYQNLNDGSTSYLVNYGGFGYDQASTTQQNVNSNYGYSYVDPSSVGYYQPATHTQTSYPTYLGQQQPFSAYSNNKQASSTCISAQQPYTDFSSTQPSYPYTQPSSSFYPDICQDSSNFLPQPSFSGYLNAQTYPVYPNTQQTCTTSLNPQPQFSGYPSNPQESASTFNQYSTYTDSHKSYSTYSDLQQSSSVYSDPQQPCSSFFPNMGQVSDNTQEYDTTIQEDIMSGCPEVNDEAINNLISKGGFDVNFSNNDIGNPNFIDMIADLQGFKEQYERIVQKRTEAQSKQKSKISLEVDMGNDTLENVGAKFKLLDSILLIQCYETCQLVVKGSSDPIKDENELIARCGYEFMNKYVQDFIYHECYSEKSNSDQSYFSIKQDEQGLVDLNTETGAYANHFNKFLEKFSVEYSGVYNVNINKLVETFDRQMEENTKEAFYLFSVLRIFGCQSIRYFGLFLPEFKIWEKSLKTNMLKKDDYIYAHFILSLLFLKIEFYMETIKKEVNKGEVNSLKCLKSLNCFVLSAKGLLYFAYLKLFKTNFIEQKRMLLSMFFSFSRLAIPASVDKCILNEYSMTNEMFERCNLEILKIASKNVEVPKEVDENGNLEYYEILELPQIFLTIDHVNQLKKLCEQITEPMYTQEIEENKFKERLDNYPKFRDAYGFTNAHKRIKEVFDKLAPSEE